MSVTDVDKAAPMAAAPIKYRPDGEVDWGNMWDTFCDLALDGGPAHRSDADGIAAPASVDAAHPEYARVVAEICRGIREVSGLAAAGAEPGWIAVECPQPGMARWLAAAIGQERVAARVDGKLPGLLLLPVAEHYTLKGEIKSIITVVAKTTHYWVEHLPLEVKRALAMEERVQSAGRRLRGWLSRSSR